MKKIIGVGETEDGHGHKFDALTPLEQTLQKSLRQLDPMGMFASLANVQTAWLSHPSEMTRAMTQVLRSCLELYQHSLNRLSGVEKEDAIIPHPDDLRFSDPLWNSSPQWALLKEYYLGTTRILHDLCTEAPGLAFDERRKAAFWLRNWLNALAPTNFLATNPVALAKYKESKGQSLRTGMANFSKDQQGKTVRMVEAEAFTVGVDLATTPGKVIHRNKLVELIYYTPTTKKVQKTPILIVTPWINKYYVLDLTSKKSMVKFLVDQGYSVFITSWKNPDASMANIDFSDYLLTGVKECIDVVQKFCQVEQVNLVGYCIGGTLVSCYMAWMNKNLAKSNVLSWTLFTTLSDFSRPGDIEVFVDEESIASMEKRMKIQGYLDGNQMASSFRMLRANSLIWSFWVKRYLLGESLPAFDVLFWNMDTTRMPEAMHSFYLRNMYLENRLIKRNQLTVADTKLDLSLITQPLYAVSAEDDHIAPWQQCYRIRKYINAKAEVRFVLSSSGHILGIVNPPVNPPKRNFRAGSCEINEHWDVWREHSQVAAGSWWDDWSIWLKQQNNEEVSAPKLSTEFPGIVDAPGDYVLAK